MVVSFFPLQFERIRLAIRMKTKELVLCAAFLVSATSIGCSDNPVATNALAGRGFFPMQVGNEWTYAHEVDQDFVWTTRIVGKAQISLYEYFIYETRFAGGVGADTMYFRAGPSAKIFVNWRGNDVLYIDFDRKVGKWWNTFSEYKASVLRRNLKTEVPAGTFANAIEIFFDIPQAIDDEFWNVYARGIGLIQLSGQIGRMQLTSAVVNGVEVP